MKHSAIVFALLNILPGLLLFGYAPVTLALAPAPELSETPQTPAAPAIPCMVDIDATTSSAESCDDDKRSARLSVQFGQRMVAGQSNILGEFDGIGIDYQLAGNIRVNGVAGYTVLSDADKFNASRQVLGLSANSRKFAGSWDLNSYLIEQKDHDLAQRNAGGAVRYLNPDHSVLLMFDYDLAQHSVAAVTTLGSIRLPREFTLSTAIDVRSSPLRLRQQKYLHQSMSVTEGWNWELPMDRISSFTQDHSQEVTTLAIALSHKLSRRFELVGSAARLDVEKDEYFYRLRLSGSDLVFTGTNNNVDFNHRVTEMERSSSATLDSRYSINHHWAVSPRLHTGHSDKLNEQVVQWVAAPSVKMEYQWYNRYGVNIEAGGEWVTSELADDTSRESSYFVNLGYQAKF